MDHPTYSQIAHKPSSPTLSTFAPSKILPISVNADEPVPSFAKLPQNDSAGGFGVDEQPDGFEEENDAQVRKHLSMTSISAYDLAPPPPRVSHENAELLAERLFSADHLNVILKDPSLSHRFTGFLNRYRPNSVPTLVRYLESQKALAAIRYANSLADQISIPSRRSSRSEVAVVDTKFESFSRRAIDELVSEALPAYITYRMVQVVTECLVKEITGNNTPLMQELVQGLAEVYCLTDPSLPDNPIVFASEEFYNTTQYGQEYVIGKNCRFLQGPKTQPLAVKRISEALHNGVEVCEILLNYRRDGSPFLNLVMMAPLMDHHGNVRYFIGCQIDISHLIEGGRGLESFKQLLDRDLETAAQKPLPDPLDHKPSLKVLRELGSLLNDEEMNVVQEHNRRKSIDSGRSTPTRTMHSHTTRRFVGMDEPIEPSLWPPSQFGHSGRLPGVYQNYLLVRPYPSLRIIFTSAALRIPGLSQSRLMDRIGGPQHVRESLMEALAQGVGGVTAKISWLTHPKRPSQSQTQTSSNTNGSDSPGSLDSEVVEGRPRWIHCTPLLGSDSKPGVIMVVMVDNEEITGSLNPGSGSLMRSRLVMRSRDAIDGWPLKGLAVANSQFTSAKLYAEYLRREGRESRAAHRENGERRSVASDRSGNGEESFLTREGGVGRDKSSRSTSVRKVNGRERDREREA